MWKSSAVRLASISPTKQAASKIFAARNFCSKRDLPVDQQQNTSYYTAKDVEFSPNRAREVMQNNVEESTKTFDGQNMPKRSLDSDAHSEAYQASSSVSLHSVMQSNVPEPFNTRDEVATHRNMPGSTSSSESKYISGKMQSVHSSKQ